MEINDQNKVDWIERYLEQDLSAEENRFFEDTIHKDESLRSEFEEHKEVEKVIKLERRKEKYRQEMKDFLNENPDVLSTHKRLNSYANYQRLAAVFLLLVTSILIIYLLLPKSKSPVIVKGDIDSIQKVMDSVVQNPDENILPNDITSIPQDSNSLAPNPEKANPKIPGQRQNEAPVYANIAKYTLKNRLGFSGTSSRNKTNHPVLFYSNPPRPDFMKSDEIYYLFEDFVDTLRVYGNIQIEELQLLYIESDIQYLLVIGQDTLEIYPDVDWQKLP